MSRITRLIAVFALVFATGAWAVEDAVCGNEIYAAIERDLRLADFAERAQDENKRFIVSQACKSWPYKPELTLVALAYDEGVEYEKELVVAVFDKKRKRIVNSYQQRIQEDALTEVGEYSLKLDTARYQLAEGVRAFGFSFNSSAIGASCGDGHWGEELTLLVPEGKSLRPMFSFYRYHQRSIQGCLSRQSPDAIWENAFLTLGIENTRTNGFYDLRVMAGIDPESNGAPTDHIKTRMEHVIFRYNGKHYEPVGKIPWWLSIEYPRE